MNERLIRLLRIITLIQSSPGILARELAARCETTERTIYRDLELITASYIPIMNLGHGKGYSFIGNFSLYPLNWTEEESLSFSMLPSVIDQVKTLLPPGFDRAFEKVMATYNKEQKLNSEILQQVTDVIQMGTPAYREDHTNFLLPIMQAILTQKTIRIVYHTQSRNEESERLIDPYYLVPRDHRFYLLGYCHKANDIRTFRISRIRGVQILNKTFEKNDFNIRSYLKNTWSIERGEEQIHFKVKFNKEVARYIKEEELFVKPKMKDLQDGSLVMEVIVNHEREFLQWVMKYGPDAEIIEPVAYRDRMRETLQRWQETYQ